MKPSRLITRRTALIAGVGAAGGLFVPGYIKGLPPTYGHILRMGDNLTYAAHRILLRSRGPVREYSHKDISSFPAIGTTDPAAVGMPNRSESYATLRT